MSTNSCGLAPLKKEVEIWLIDEQELLLFRKIKGGKEQVIPISENKDMNRFLCIDQREYKELYESLIELGE